MSSSCRICEHRVICPYWKTVEKATLELNGVVPLAPFNLIEENVLNRVENMGAFLSSQCPHYKEIRL